MTTIKAMGVVIVLGLTAAMILAVHGKAHADVLLNWKFVIADAPINASDCGTRISVCHNSGSKHPWHCHCPRAK